MIRKAFKNEGGYSGEFSRKKSDFQDKKRRRKTRTKEREKEKEKKPKKKNKEKDNAKNKRRKKKRQRNYVRFLRPFQKLQADLRSLLDEVETLPG